MGKVNLLIKYCLRNQESEYNIKGILQDSKLKFLDKDNKMILDLKNNTLKRITFNEEILFDFKNQVCYIKDNKNEFNFKISVDFLDSKNDYFYVKYNIDTDSFKILIKVIN